MTAEQPYALELAEYLETYGPKSNIDCTSILAAAELRRLHEVNQELLEALKAMTEIAELTIGWIPTPPNADGPLIQARAAIAKATGETK